MDPDERKGWTEVIIAEDLDHHMAEIGQAEINAYLVLKMLFDFPLKNDANLLIPGCGTGQMFDYIKPEEIGQYKLTFTDINPRYLKRLKERLSKIQNIKYSVFLDDIESTKLSAHYDGTLTVLLLQHIEWEKGIDSMLQFNPSRMYFIIQEQENGEHAITKERTLRPSIKEFSKIANPKLVPRKELTIYLEKRSYKHLKTYRKKVPDNKFMTGLVFEKKTCVKTTTTFKFIKTR